MGSTSTKLSGMRPLFPLRDTCVRKREQLTANIIYATWNHNNSVPKLYIMSINTLGNETCHERMINTCYNMHAYEHAHTSHQPSCWSTSLVMISTTSPTLMVSSSSLSASYSNVTLACSVGFSAKITRVAERIIFKWRF